MISMNKLRKISKTLSFWERELGYNHSREQSYQYSLAVELTARELRLKPDEVLKAKEEWEKYA